MGHRKVTHVFMRQDPRIHLVLDTNVLVAALSPKTCRSQSVAARANSILEAAVEHNWPLLSLHTPAFCLAEAQCVLDRHYYCKWHGESKKKEHRLTKSEYQKATDRLEHLTKSRLLQRMDLNADHLRLVPLVSSVNFKYQVRRRSKSDPKTGRSDASRIRPPMGAADCLIGAFAIELSIRMGLTDVVLVTADGRLADVMGRCRKLTPERMKSCHLDDIARRASLSWNADLYPPCLHLGKATDADLHSTLRGWPLPTRQVIPRIIDSLSQPLEKTLYQLGQETKDSSGVGPDSLPYTIELDGLQLRFANETGIYLSKADLAKRLLAWRKNPKRRPK